MTRVMRANRNAVDGVGECPFLPWLSACVTFLSAVQLAVLGSSLASLRLTRPVAAGILVVSLLAAWLVWYELKAGVRIAPPWAMFSNHRWGWAIAGAYVALYVFLVGCAAIAADQSWDGNTYHLPVIQEWFQQGRITWLEGPDQSSLPFMNGYPKAAEVVSLFLCILVHPALSNTLNLVYLPLGILGIASIAHALGAGRRAALVAGAALLLVPVNLGQSMTTYVDSAFGSAVIASLAVTVWLRRLGPRPSGVQALVLGCALGQVIGIKGTGLLLAAVGSLLLCGVQLTARSAALSALVAWWLGVVTCALAIGGFWYARNLAHGLSPLYPVGVSVAGLTLFPGLHAYAMPGVFAVDGLIKNWPVPAQIAFTWLQGIWRWPGSIIGFDTRLGGMGFLWLLGCLPAVIALVRRRMRTWTSWRDELVRQPLWLLLAMVSASFVIVPQPWWSRYTVWLYGLGLPCLAVVGGWPMGRRGRAWLVACVAVLVIEAGIVVARWQLPIVGIAIRDEHGGPPRPGPAVRIPTHFYPPWVLRGTVIERLARANDTVGIGPLVWYQQVIFGVVSEPVGARQIYFVPADLEADFAAWYERVRPRYVIMDENVAIPASMLRLQPEVHHVRSLMVVQFW
jgi:hypothetical protein